MKDESNFQTMNCDGCCCDKCTDACCNCCRCQRQFIKKEKLISEYADALNGMNSTGEISYLVYSKMFDIGMELLEEMYNLGKSEQDKEV